MTDSTVGKQDLASKFAGSDQRRTALASSLRPLAATQTDDQSPSNPSTPSSLALVDPSTEPPTSKARRETAKPAAKSRTPRKRATAADKGGPAAVTTETSPRASTRSVAKENRTVYIRSDLRELLRAETITRQSTQTAVTLTAIETHYDRLQQAIADAHSAAAAPTKPARKLFQTEEERQYRRDHLERGPICLRLTAHNEQVLDTLEHEVGAVNRSDLVEAALALEFAARLKQGRRS